MLPESLRVGQMDIDIQHETLFSLIELMQTNSNEMSCSEIGYIVQTLQDYASLHFTYEEKRMNEQSYSDHAAHLQEHLNFHTAMATFDQRLEQAKESDVMRCEIYQELANYLDEWLKHHIATVDRALFADAGNYVK
uniref:Putative bacteriohemerythrin n=1 Tax=Magnetococcus massalia (strain MO-1) TaxID=451514 RepID=A0A1S7LEE5_MAGMO|nr:Putative bacteriohemerythrin [Candidatus Magnetococcus massalia]